MCIYLVKSRQAGKGPRRPTGPTGRAKGQTRSSIARWPSIARGWPSALTPPACLLGVGPVELRHQRVRAQVALGQLLSDAIERIGLLVKLDAVCLCDHRILRALLAIFFEQIDTPFEQKSPLLLAQHGDF